MAHEPSDNMKMDPLTATKKVAKAIMATPTGNGRLVATILSAYDLPYESDVPLAVTMQCWTDHDNRPSMGSEPLSPAVSTGPPLAKHLRHTNTFRFGSAEPDNSNNNNNNNNSSNQLVLSAPLPALFQAKVVFTLTYTDTDKNLSSKCSIHKTIRVNDTQWLILNLDNSQQPATNPQLPIHSSQSHISNSSSSFDNPPTLRLKLRLEGPYRPEIAALINLSNAWFHTVDLLTDSTFGTLSNITHDLPSKLPALKLLLVPTVPVATLIVSSLPVILGLLLLTLPLFLPILLLILLPLLFFTLLSATLYFSTRDGRTALQHLLEPSFQTFLMNTTLSQRILYDVGPRPSPQALAHAILPTSLFGKLFVSLLIDFIGSCSYLLPLLGEGADLAWAPMSMVLVGALYDDTVSTNLKYVSLVEELLPLTDILPSATLGWVMEFGPGVVEEFKKRMGSKGENHQRKMVRVASGTNGNR